MLYTPFGYRVGRKLPADRGGTQDAGIDVKQFHGFALSLLAEG
jgi:hypothetical protein